MIQTTKLKKVVIIFQDNLEERLIHDLKALGARGYTIEQVRGAGLFGARESEWEGENIRVECICTTETAYKILEHLQAYYFEKYAGIAYLTEVEVIRSERF
jgi:nitrogen regulatory protein P-II 2